MLCWRATDRSMLTRGQNLKFADRFYRVKHVISTAENNGQTKQTNKQTWDFDTASDWQKGKRVVWSSPLLVTNRNCLKSILKTCQFLLLQFRQVDLHLFPACFQRHNSLSLFIHLSFRLAKSLLKSSETLAVWNRLNIRFKKQLL